MNLRCLLCIPLLLVLFTPTLAEKPKNNEGFTPLFNGKNLDGWVVMGKAEGWTVKNGVIHSDGGKGGNWMRTTKQYDDYILRLQWRVSKGGNSGVFIRCSEKGSPWLTGYEVQILNAPRDKSHATGSLYGYAAVNSIPDSSPGKWHSYEIRCRGSHITTIVDGLSCVEFDQAKSDKAKDKPLVGYIGLQDSHSKPGHFIEFRDIKIKTLD